MGRNLLIVAYEFYPINTGGSHRPFRIAKYLLSKGFHVEVITRPVRHSHSNFDYSLLRKLHSLDIVVHEVPIKESKFIDWVYRSYYLNTIDSSFISWKKALIPYLAQVFETSVVDTLLITAPPFSVLNLVRIIKSKYSVTVITDLRDAWSQWNIVPYASRLHYRLTLLKERKVLDRSDYTFVTSLQTKNDLIRLHGDRMSKKIIYIPNSFEEYLSEKTGVIQIPASREKFKIGYIGSFYYHPYSYSLTSKSWYKKKPYQYFQFLPRKEDWKYRSPFYFFKTINGLFEKSPELRSKVQINLAVSKSPWIVQMADNFNLLDQISFCGTLEKTEVPNFLLKQDALLLTSSKVVSGLDYSIAGKTFEYFASLKPILAFVCEGAQRDILEGTGLALHFDPDENDNNIEKMKDLLEYGRSLEPNYEIIDRYLTKNVLSVAETTLSSVSD